METTALLDDLQAKAGDATRLLAELANANRLLALCHLAVEGEMSVGRLADAVGLSQSALSQHLSRLRAAGLVDTRKDAQTVFYRVADDRLLPILMVLRDQFCPELQAGGPAGGKK